MITYRLDDLRNAVKAIQDAEAKLAGNSNPKARAMIEEARALVAALPITEAQAADPAFAGIFKKKRKKATDKVTGRSGPAPGSSHHNEPSYRKARRVPDRKTSKAWMPSWSLQGCIHGVFPIRHSSRPT